MSFTEQQLSEGIRTSHDFSNNKRRLKRKRDARDWSQHTITIIKNTELRHFSF